MKKLLIIFFFYTFTFAASPHSFWDTYTAALRGDKVAQFRTAVIFEQGIGMESNQSQAAKWYEKAAIQGHMDAQYNLGLMYASGRGVEQNDQFAMMWLASAAKQGNREARKLLLDMIDGKLDSDIHGVSESIKPITFTIKKNAQVCDTNGSCETYKSNTTFTSKRKKGTYYQVSGIGTVSGWKAYNKEGWVDENSIEIRR